MKKYRIVMAEESQPFVNALTALVNVEFDIVGTAHDGKTALDLIRHHQPDLAVLDLHMPTLSGIDVARELADDLPNLTIMICSMETDVDVVEAVRDMPGNRRLWASSYRQSKSV